MHERRSLIRGTTLVELLIVVVILGLLLALLTAFFASQVRATSGTQAANEVEVKVRTSAELIAQDLQMAGSRIVVNTSGAVPVTTYVNDIMSYCSPLKGTTEYCVRTSEAGSDLTTFYASSLRLSANPCRRVDYVVDGGILMRSEVGCGEAVTFQPLAERIDPIAIEFLCESGVLSNDPADCYTAGSFPQQATVLVTGHSLRVREGRTSSVELVTTMPNLRPVAISE